MSSRTSRSGSSFPLALLAACVLLNGCTTAREEFPGQGSGQVWSALVAVAESPDYDKGGPEDRWTVRSNSVWVDEPNRRIEIYRELDRELHLPRRKPRREERSWRFRVTMYDGDGAPPAAEFESRDAARAAAVWAEALRYFDDVWALLGGRAE